MKKIKLINPFKIFITWISNIYFSYQQKKKIRTELKKTILATIHEYNLIKAKKSKLPLKEREAVEHNISMLIKRGYIKMKKGHEL